jgi:hypothetical protein
VRLRRAGGSAHLIPQGDEQRGDVLAVPIDFRKRWTCALGRETARGELNKDAIRRGIGPSDLATSRSLVDLDFVDGVAPDVVVAAEKGARSEQAPQRAIVKRRDRIVKGIGQALGSHA